MRDDMDAHLHLRLSSALRRRLEDEAARDHRTPSALVRVILERALADERPA